MAAFQIDLRESTEHEVHNIALAADRLTNTVIPGGQVFSLNETIGPYTEDQGFLPGRNYIAGQVTLDVGGGVCMIATMLYNLTVLSNLPVVQRKPHSMTVPYVPPGQDASVSWTAGVDYRFRNNTSGPILIWAKTADDELSMAFYGQEPAPAVKWRHEILSHTPAATVRRYNPELAAHEERLVNPGFDGYLVRSWAEVTFADGQTTIRHLGTSHYMPSPRIIEHGIQIERGATDFFRAKKGPDHEIAIRSWLPGLDSNQQPPG
ncbi:MAG: VanW family protein [Limnochordia bacterium]